MAISAKDVKDLRERTGMGMMECKKALTDAEGDMDKAVELLRERAGGKMDDRGDRQQAEGCVAIAEKDGAIAIVSVLTETDFAARNETFQEKTQAVADLALAASGTGEIEPTDEMKTLVEDLRVTIKENISLGTVQRLEGEKVGGYVHLTKKLGAIVTAEGDIENDTLRGICQHISAAAPPLCPTPVSVDEDGLPADLVESARQQFVQEAEETGKPKEIAEKISAGKLNKWKQDHTLMGQTYIRELDAKKPVRDYVPTGAKITGFFRLQIGV